MKFEHISNKALVLWELLAVLGFGALFAVSLWLLLPGTWLWYTVLWIIGAAFIIMTFLYLPIAYLNIEYAIGKEAVIYRKGVIFPNTEVLYRDRIVFVTVYKNPLTPILHISSLVISAAGGTMRILFIDDRRAEEIARRLSGR